MSRLFAIVTSPDPATRDQELAPICERSTIAELLAECEALEQFRRQSESLYERVRALFFLAAIHRYHLPPKLAIDASGRVPYTGHAHLLERRFEEAIAEFAQAAKQQGPSEPVSMALAAAYRGLAFQTLADQVRHSVRSLRGNQWMFRMGHVLDYPLQIRPELLAITDGRYPVLVESTPVRMDLSHSAWSDIFFLGMDYPEGARVVNVSVDLCVRGTASRPQPPIQTFLRVIDEPVLRLVSVDLAAQVELTEMQEVFDFGRDHLGLIKAAVIASGLIPAGLEGSGQSLPALLSRLTGKPGHGLEISSAVHNIPKGSRLAVSTNLLASLIAVSMRATRQIDSLTGGLAEAERRLVAARAILGEWIGGSGGGWQDSGGVWPGIKLIEGASAQQGDPEFGISRGRLLPQHRVLGLDAIPAETRQRLQDSLVLVHGGMAQDVGPILEMVTERYLLRLQPEWHSRQQARRIVDDILGSLRAGDLQSTGRILQSNYEGPIQSIIPWAGNYYTDSLIAQMQQQFGRRFWGFWMLGGMAGGGMGFVFDPEVKAQAQDALWSVMRTTKKRMEPAIPFGMDPVVYDFAINENGTWAQLRTGAEALLTPGYYALRLPSLIRRELRTLTAGQRAELGSVAQATLDQPAFSGIANALIEQMLPRQQSGPAEQARALDDLLTQHGFDREQHEHIRAELKSGRVGLAQNILPRSASIEDVRPTEVTDTRSGVASQYRTLGEAALGRGEVGVLTLAGGAGSRWTGGAGVVKALHPFCRMAHAYRTFLEIHLAKSRRTQREFGRPVPHIFTTSYLTQEPIAAHLDHHAHYGYPPEHLYLSPGRSIGLRLIPTARDLRFLWEQTPQQTLDQQKQKVRDSGRAALLGWAQQAGEASDYRDNLPAQCLHPVGHWYEFPNLLLNGVLHQVLQRSPQLKHLLLHNVDTLGADLDPALLGLHLAQGAALSVEVIARSAEDRGGGLARVDGRLRLVEGLAMPDERLEFELSYYNSGTMWLDIDRVLAVFGLDRTALSDSPKVTRAVRRLAARMPTYITIKDVKKRWGRGQEDVYPVSQFEKIWGDMTALTEVDAQYLVVTRRRGQQLKQVAQLDGWLRDGSAAYVEGLGDWT